MSRLDLIIFGATGFTGKHAVKELGQIAKKYPGLTWGVAGRSRPKLNNMLEEISKKTDEDLSSVKIIIADVSDEKSLRDMCEQARVLVNCCGPYRLYGEPVVKAAIDSRTHYVDVSGEPQFIETMQLVYDAAARDAGVFVISACGFDSIPNDLGVIYLQQNFGGTVNSVESYLSSSSASSGYYSEGLVNYGTWESLVYGLAHYSELPALRKKIYPEPLPPLKPKLLSRVVTILQGKTRQMARANEFMFWFQFVIGILSFVTPIHGRHLLLITRGVLHRRDGGWCVPFPGADSSVVYRTQRALLPARPTQVRTYVRLQSLLAALLTLLAALVLFGLSKLAATRRLLLAFPELFSLGAVRRGPSEEAIAATRFRFDLHGEGWAAGDAEEGALNKKILVRVSGVNPGYGATVHALLHSALSVLTQRDRMPEQTGVITPGTAFRNTDIIQRLKLHNLVFEVVEDK